MRPKELQPQSKKVLNSLKTWQGPCRAGSAVAAAPGKYVMAGLTPCSPPILSPSLLLRMCGCGDYPPSSDTTSSLVTASCSRSSRIFFSRLEYGCSSMPSLWVREEGEARLQGGWSKAWGGL